MKNIKLFGAMSATFLMLSAHASAQIVLNPISFQQPESTVIGPDGTFYELVPGANSTIQSPTSELNAFNTAGKSWTAPLSARVTQVLPGATTVFVVETAYSGTGRNTTTTTTIALVSTSNGAVSSTTIVPTGNIIDIEERTVGTSDYLYVVNVTTTTATPASSAHSDTSITTTTTRTLTIYSSTGAIVNTGTL